MSIDIGTLLLQVINVLVLLWLLQRYLYRPVTAVVGQRQAMITQKLDEIRQLREQAEALKAGLESDRAGLGEAREKLLVEARAAAKAERESIMSKAAEEARTQLKSAEAQGADLQRMAKRQMEVQAGEFAIRIARSLLERLPTEIVARAFIEDCCLVLTGLTPEQKEMMLEDVREQPVIVTASHWSPEQIEYCRQALERVLLQPARLEFKESQEPLAGMEVRFRRLVVKNRWSEDLERLQLQLSHDDAAAST